MPSIAIVDDDVDVLALFRSLVEPYHEVRTYSDATSALAGVKQDRPDVVLLDISLGDANGVDVLHHLRAQAGLAALPVIAVTAHSQRVERARFLSEGFTDYVAKPLTDYALLLAVIETALRGESSPWMDDEIDDVATPSNVRQHDRRASRLVEMTLAAARAASALQIHPAQTRVSPS